MESLLSGFGVEAPTTLGAVGILGVILYLGSYAALQFGFLRGRGYAYPALNGAAAFCVLLSLAESFNFSSLLIQVFWIAISAYGVVRLYLARNRVRFSREERDLLDLLAPDLPREHARAFLNLGGWVEGEAGEVLIEEGRPVRDLVYLTSGSGVVGIGDEVVTRAEAPVLFGEITSLDGSPATATVTLGARSRMFAIDARRLRAFLDRDPEVRSNIEASFRSGIADKLAMASRTLMERRKANDIMHQALSHATRPRARP